MSSRQVCRRNEIRINKELQANFIAIDELYCGVILYTHLQKITKKY